jgi:type I restriction enzyme S subunit
MVEWKSLGEICNVLDNRRKPVSKGNRNKGIYPYYGANGVQDYVDDYIFDGTYLLLGEDGSVINSDKSPVLHWATGKIWVNNHAHILEENDNALLRYVYYSLQCTDVSDIVRGIPPKINQANMRGIQIPLPSKADQERIVGILDTFTASIENLKEQIALRRKQYEYYRDQLLDLEGKDGVEMKTLGDVCVRANNIKWRSESDQNFYFYVDLSSVDIDTHQIGMLSEINKNTAPSRAQQIIEEGDVLLGTTRPTLKRYCLIPAIYNNHICSTGFCVFRANNNFVLNKWVYYNISNSLFWEYCEKKQQGAGYPSLSNNDAFAYRIPVLSLSKQQRIVDILDKFEESIQNLETQLSLREKQYEYYRNKLLTFE